MKKINKALILGFLGLVGWLTSCQNPIEGLEIFFKKPYPIALEAQYYTAEGTVPDKIQVQITGPDQKRVITTVNTKKFRVTSDGSLFLAIDSLGVRPSATQPLRFTVVVQAEGFFPSVLPLEYTSDSPRSVGIVLQPLSGASSIKQATTSADAKGSITSAWTFETPTGEGTTKATVSAGTEVKDPAGQPVLGKIEATFQSLAITKQNASLLPFPIDNQMIVKPLLADGTVGSDQQLTQLAGAFLLQMHNEHYQVVKTFSQPIEVKMPVSAQLYNTRERRLVAEGDAIPLFSYDIATNQWKVEEAGKVQKLANGSLEYVARLPHLSVWVAGFTKQKCETGLSFRVKSTLPNSSSTYQCEVIDEVSGARLQVFKSTINNGEIIKVTGLDSDQHVRLRITDNWSTTMALSTLVSGCTADVQEIDVTTFKKPTVKCDNGPGFRIKSNFPRSDYRYTCEVINETTKATLQSFQTTVNNGDVIRANGLDSDQKIRLKIYDIVSAATAISEVVESCATDIQTLDITHFKLPPQACATTPTFTIKSNLPDSDRQYTCEVIRADTKARLQIFQTSVNNGRQIRLGGLYDNTGSIQFRIFDMASSAVVTTSPLDACSGQVVTVELANFKVPAPKCASPLGFRVVSTLPNSSLVYQCEVLNAATNAKMQSFQTTINNGEVIRVNGLYSDETVKLRIYDLSSNAVATSTAVEACNAAIQSIDVTSFKKPIVKCASPLYFRVTSKLPTSSQLYGCEVINENTKAVLARFQSTVNNGQVLKIEGLDSDQKVRLRIADVASSAVATSAAVDACASETQPIDLSSFATLPPIETGEVLITLQFPCTEIDATKLPTQELFGRFRLSGTVQWQNLPSIKYIQGKTTFSTTTTLLKVGSTYDFQAGPAPGYYSFSENNYKLESSNWVIKIKTDEYCKK
ncbi:hypothetical protein [Runella limosa]|uniref:hypothetical protein n=1 Tax=Runella limosa TaxID=370978 RepID=UPI00040CE050|nr:hypothetical protein [Runella limosa]